MSKKILMAVIICALGLFFAFAGLCYADDSQGTTASCYNGNFTGHYEDNGILSFKGIPYAKQPVGNLRWKAPKAAAKSDATYDAKDFGKTSIQYQWHSEPASYNNKIGEDCLSLNVWTKDLKGSNKPVMFYIHGGGFAWGGTSDPLYNGKFIVKEHSDVIVVSCNYRVGLMGFVDFSGVPGGSSYKDSTHLGVLDLIQGLKWVKQNISQFGGDPNNVTIFGESAGGALVSDLLVAKQANGLFKHAIAESGSLNLTYNKQDFKDWGLTKALLKKTDAKNMKQLVAIPEAKLIKLYTSYDKNGNCLNDLYNMPMRGDSVIPSDPYKALAAGRSKGVDVMIGTNADEWRYWINEMGEKEMKDMTADERVGDILSFNTNVAKAKYSDAMSAATKAEKKKIKQFLASQGSEDNMWKYTELGNETGFRLPSIKTAYSHAKAGGNTYMYYFDKKSTNYDYMGACHASELAYVFHNLDETIFSGTVDKGLSDEMCTAWVNFAKTGNPSTSDVTWDKYTTKDRNTMVIGNDCTMKMQSDPLSQQRKLLSPLVKYYLK